MHGRLPQGPQGRRWDTVSERASGSLIDGQSPAGIKYRRPHSHASSSGGGRPARHTRVTGEMNGRPTAIYRCARSAFPSTISSL